jgi:hypothetical protein
MRREDSGKEILIGVYNDEIISTRFPATLLSLVIRVVVWVDREDFRTARLTIKNPDGTTMVDISQHLGPLKSSMKGIFGFGMAHPTFVSPGIYEVNFSLDAESQTVGNLRVRPPESEDEKRRSGVYRADSAPGWRGA